MYVHSLIAPKRRCTFPNNKRSFLLLVKFTLGLDKKHDQRQFSSLASFFFYSHLCVIFELESQLTVTSIFLAVLVTFALKVLSTFLAGKDLHCSAESPCGNLKILCTRLRSRASKEPTVKCCVKQCNRADTDQSAPAKRRKRRSTSPSSSQTETPVASNLHRRCKICQKQNPHCCISIETEKELTVKTSEQSDVFRPMHVDGSECDCTCFKCCWTIEDTAYELLERCLDLNPHTRITAAEALEHPFLRD